MIFDAIVLGLGGMGSAAACHLAQRGKAILGIDQLHPPHDRGSSHGGTRMIRQAYGEGAYYIPLVLRAYELWAKLEQDTHVRLLNVTGGLVLGSADGPLVTRATAAARHHSIPFEMLENKEIPRRFLAIKPLPGDVAMLELRAGYLSPEACVHAHLQAASQSGAHLQFNEKVRSWTAGGAGVEVKTDRATYHAAHLVITSGPWTSEILGISLPLRVTRQVVAWIQPIGGIGAFSPDHFPVFLSESREDGMHAYGFPAVDGESGGVKAAIHGSLIECTPDTVDRSVHADDHAALIRKVSQRMPALAGKILQSQTCLYTMTPDEDFVLGPHPHHPSVSIACGFSGHGFKFASVVGEILADLALDGETRHSIEVFSPRRFSR
jgi:sarcosine oxidase